MHTISEQFQRVLLRTNVLRQRGEKRLLKTLAALCGAISAALISVFATVNGWAQGGVQGLYGSVLMFYGGGGYVLVGVLAFGLAVVITVLCLRYRGKHEE